MAEREFMPSERATTLRRIPMAWKLLQVYVAYDRVPMILKGETYLLEYIRELKVYM